MSIEEKRRAAFESWFQAEMLPRITGSQAIVRAMCEKGWNAALDSVVINLPAPPAIDENKETYTRTQSAYHQGMMAVIAAIESAGLKVKP